jgi:TonB family protein
MRSFARVLALVLVAAVPAIAQPPQPVRVGQNIKPPSKTKDVRPAYPALAQSARVQGVVIIEVTLGEDGHVRDTRILRSIPLLDAAALEAVRQWEFTPTLLNGAAVPVIMTVTVNFTLDELLPRSCTDERSMRSPDGAPPATIQFINLTDVPRRVFWLDGTGVRHWMLSVSPGETAAPQTTAVGHTWVIANAQDTCSAVFVADGKSSRAVISNAPGIGEPPILSPR